MNKPLILITNDDGIQAGGIHELALLAKKYGRVTVVAPNGPRSAQSSALTIEQPVYAINHHSEDDIQWFSCSGTPTDCVKLAITQLMPERPQLILSGINHGSNASINVIYSGTMGAAIEGCLHGIPSIGFSLCNHSLNADFSPCLPFFEKILKDVIDNGLPKDVCLNVNAPAIPVIKGIKVCRQAEGRWGDDFIPAEAPRPNKYYWMTGDFNFEKSDDLNLDQIALEAGYISIVPTTFDLTAYRAMDYCRRFESK